MSDRKIGDHMAGQGNRKLTPLGKEIRKKLIDKDMSQVELAEKLGTTTFYLSRIMHGARSGNKYLGPICIILDINPELYQEQA